MKIKLHLNPKSIEKAINKLKQVRQELKVMLKQFFHECFNYFVERANYYLLSVDIGNKPKSEIENGWYYTKLTENGVIIKNDAEKAVFVEFGVGVEGYDNPHPNADNTDYQYSVESPYKLWDGAWVFKSTEDELDIPEDAIFGKGVTKNGQLKILTMGTQATMFAYNALMDLKMEYKNIWQQIKIDYWG